MTDHNASEVVLHQGGGASFVAPDGVNLFRAITLRNTMRLYAKNGMRPNRNLGPAQMLLIAKEYTGKDYKRSQIEQAVVDVSTWIETMKAALPITNVGEQP